MCQGIRHVRAEIGIEDKNDSDDTHHGTDGTSAGFQHQQRGDTSPKQVHSSPVALPLHDTSVVQKDVEPCANGQKNKHDINPEEDILASLVPPFRHGKDEEGKNEDQGQVNRTLINRRQGTNPCRVKLKKRKGNSDHRHEETDRSNQFSLVNFEPFRLCRLRLFYRFFHYLVPLEDFLATPFETVIQTRFSGIMRLK